MLFSEFTSTLVTWCVTGSLKSFYSFGLPDSRRQLLVVRLGPVGGTFVVDSTPERQAGHLSRKVPSFTLNDERPWTARSRVVLL